MDKASVLFVCVHNSARSQMAEALLNHMAGDRFQAQSAGLESGKLFKYVITVCDEASGERCPLFPGVTNRLHWSFDDPATFAGTHAEKLAKTIIVRDQIKARIQAWVHELNP
jgi:arsenate reductase